MTTVRIFARGGDGFGTGHLRRSLWLAAALAAQPWCQAVQRRVEPPFDLLPEGLNKGDLVVYDWLESNSNSVLPVIAAGVRVVLLDDYGPMREQAHLVVNALLSPLEAAQLATAQGRIVSGAQWVQLAPDAVKLRYVADATSRAMATELSAPASVGPVRIALVSLGGLPDMDAVDLALSALALTGFDGRVIVMPAPRGVTVPAALDVELLPASDDFHGLLAAADIAICAGGLTLYEAACLGVPAVCIAVADHQTDTGRKLEAAGTCLYAGRAGHVPPAGVAAKLRTLLADPAMRGRMSAAGMRLIDGRGLQRTVDAVGELVVS